MRVVRFIRIHKNSIKDKNVDKSGPLVSNIYEYTV